MAGFWCPALKLECGEKTLDLTTPQVMGILNLTPDSFSDGGKFLDPAKALERALAMQEQGAAIIDVGGESTRPGANPVPLLEELRRVIPVIESLVSVLKVPVSVDTSKAEVMAQAVAVGAGMINDVRALTEPGALRAATDAGVPVCLMHMQGQPASMQAQPGYLDPVREVLGFLLERAEICCGYGMERSRLIIDPGFGFGKTTEHNFRIFSALGRFCAAGFPVMVGVSRKSMIDSVAGAAVNRRLGGGVALATLAAGLGVKLIRTHDVEETVQAITVCNAVKHYREVSSDG